MSINLCLLVKKTDSESAISDKQTKEVCQKTELKYLEVGNVQSRHLVK